MVLGALALMLAWCQDRYSSTRALCWMSEGYQWSGVLYLRLRYSRMAVLLTQQGTREGQALTGHSALPKLPLLLLLSLLLPLKTFRSGFPVESRDHRKASNSYWHQWLLITSASMKTLTCWKITALLDSTGAKQTINLHGPLSVMVPPLAPCLFWPISLRPVH